jgi:hypothetical protein
MSCRFCRRLRPKAKRDVGCAACGFMRQLPACGCLAIHNEAAVYQSGRWQPKRGGGRRNLAASSSGGQARPGRPWWYPPWQIHRLRRIAIPLTRARLASPSGRCPGAFSFRADPPESTGRVPRKWDKCSHFAFSPVPLRTLAYPSIPLAGHVGGAVTQDEWWE